MSKRVLIVEDEILIGMDLAQQLSQAGFVPVGPECNVSNALERLAAEGCDLAILDINLGSETSGPVAQALRALRVPFVITSGYSSDHSPDHFAGAPLLIKPVDIPDLIATLNEVA